MHAVIGLRRHLAAAEQITFGARVVCHECFPDSMSEMLPHRAGDGGSFRDRWGGTLRPASMQHLGSRAHLTTGCLSPKCMVTQPIPDIHAEAEPQASWLPMVVIAMAQILMI